ncbi:MAG: aldehyde dehydrogenase family protein [Rhodococcus sp. (in: high G+C Gram-positive bacteria)]
MISEVKINSIDARTGEALATIALATGADEVERLAHAAAGAAPWFAALGRTERARLLEQLAAGLEARRDDIVAIADTETVLIGPTSDGRALFVTVSSSAGPSVASALIRHRLTPGRS